MDSISDFLHWFFSFPTATIALVSTIIAFCAYTYQRKEKRKKQAYQIANIFGKEFIPKLRFISYILIDLNDSFFSRFSGKMEDFDRSELISILNEQHKTIEDIIVPLEKIDINTLESASRRSGLDINSMPCYSLRDTIPEKERGEQLSFAFQKFIIDFLNEIEAMALLFRYNIADEKVVYPILHQLFLKHMKYWYYFIADNNYQNESQYYVNLIWLYRKWIKRQTEQKQKSAKKPRRPFGGSL